MHNNANSRPTPLRKMPQRVRQVCRYTIAQKEVESVQVTNKITCVTKDSSAIE